MFSTSLLEFEARRNELHRQAAEYRLIKSLRNSNPWIRKALSTAGRLMVEAGQQLTRNHQAAQTA